MNHAVLSVSLVCLHFTSMVNSYQQYCFPLELGNEAMRKSVGGLAIIADAIVAKADGEEDDVTAFSQVMSHRGSSVLWIARLCLCLVSNVVSSCGFQIYTCFWFVLF